MLCKDVLLNIYDEQQMGPVAQLLFIEQLRWEVKSDWRQLFSLFKEVMVQFLQGDGQCNTHFRQKTNLTSLLLRYAWY